MSNILQEIMQEGTLVIITEGSHEDYTIVDIVKVLKTFSNQEKLEEFYTLYPDERTLCNNTLYVDYLVLHRFVEKVDYEELNLPW